jgi:hypothetical protein
MASHITYFLSFGDGQGFFTKFLYTVMVTVFVEIEEFQNNFVTCTIILVTVNKEM